jgi:hypothetical protein
MMLESEEAKADSSRYTELRSLMTHEHCLGPGGYARKEEQWDQEDIRLAEAGIPNPWDEYPDERSRTWLQARSRLQVKDDVAEILWNKDSAKQVTEDVKAKQA